MLTDISLTKRAIDDVNDNKSLVDGIKELRKFLHDGGLDYVRHFVTIYSRAYTNEATRVGLWEIARSHADTPTKENVMLGFMEEVPEKPGHYRLTPAGKKRAEEIITRATNAPGVHGVGE